VLLAGQANNHTWWNAAREDFHATRTTVTTDYRGTGASDKPDSLLDPGLRQRRHRGA
jgi:hypothetical protein